MIPKRKYTTRNEVALPDVNYGGHIPPNATDIEAAVLGAILSEGKYIDKVMGEFSPELFYHPSNVLIAQAIYDLNTASKPIDVYSVIQQLKTDQSIDKVGGEFYVAQIISKTLSAANLEYHIRLLQQEALKRKVITVCSSAVKDAFDPMLDIFKTYDKTIMHLDTSFKAVMKYEVSKIGILHEQLIKESLYVVEHGIKSGVPSGLRMLDNVTNGWQKSDLIILAGRPSMGKTAAGLTIAYNAAVKNKKPVGVFSLEMSKSQCAARLQSISSNINVSKIVKKQLTLQDINQISMAGVELETAPLFIDDTASITLIELKAKARRMVAEQGVELIIVDYLQLMRSGFNITNREQEVAEISKGLKGLAKELDIPVIALSQLSRSVESRGGDRKPNLSDLRESGQIEQDADMVIFAWRPEYYAIESYEIDGINFESHGLFMALIAKHRNGSLGEIPFKFVHELAKIENHSFNLHNEDENKDTENKSQLEGADGLHSGAVNSGPEYYQPTDEKPAAPSMYDLGRSLVEDNIDDTPF
jgi:replicative DNA helicase